PVIAILVVPPFSVPVAAREPSTVIVPATVQMSPPMLAAVPVTSKASPAAFGATLSCRPSVGAAAESRAANVPALRATGIVWAAMVAWRCARASAAVTGTLVGTRRLRIAATSTGARLRSTAVSFRALVTAAAETVIFASAGIESSVNRNCPIWVTLGSATTAAASTALTRSRGVMSALAGALPSVTFPTLNWTVPPASNLKVPAASVTPVWAPETKEIPSTGASTKMPVSIWGVAVAWASGEVGAAGVTGAVVLGGIGVVVVVVVVVVVSVGVVVCVVSVAGAGLSPPPPQAAIESAIKNMTSHNT